MNNTNPFVTQGSLLEQKNKKRARVKVAVYAIFAINLLVISPLLIQGCSKKNTDADTQANTPVDTNTPPAVDTNGPQALPPVTSNTPPVAPPTNVVTAPPVTIAPPTNNTAEAAPHEYTITKGDTYYSIGKKFGLKMSEIKAANPGVNPSKLKAGQKIQLPAGGPGASAGTTAGTEVSGDVYVVKPGDTLGKIAKANGVSLKALKSENGLKTDRIKPGDKLKLPGKTAPAVPAPTTPDTTPAPATATPPALPTPSANPGAPASR